MKFSELAKTSRLNESRVHTAFYELKKKMNELESNLNGPIEEVAENIFMVAKKAISLIGWLISEHPEMKSEYDEEKNHLITILQKQK